MKKLLLIAILISAGYVGFIHESGRWLSRDTADLGDQVFASAFETRSSGFQLRP
jgi:hypothetical protein